MPTGNVEPDAGLQVTDGFGSTVSVAVALKVTAAPSRLEACTSMLPGTVSVGGVVSWTLTRKVFETELPEASVAVQVTGVTRIWKSVPEAGLQLTVGLGSTRSVALAV